MLTPGDTVERYKVESVLGEGGMAVVYRVRHTGLDSVRALKVLRIDSTDLRARLLDEGRLQASLRHPNIVEVYDAFEVEGLPALLMEYVPGGSLEDRVGHRRLDRAGALAVFDGVVRGVGHAHERGMVHRDLKPANVLVDEVGGTLVPKVADFGIAKHLHADRKAGGTRTGVAMGTPAYMAPEQVRDASHVDQRADLFALGAILYELMVGTRAFRAPTEFDVLQAVLGGRYPDLAEVAPDLPARVAAAVRACLVPDPERRIATCAALHELLYGTGPIPSPSNAEGTWPPEGPAGTWPPDGPVRTLPPEDWSRAAEDAPTEEHADDRTTDTALGPTRGEPVAADTMLPPARHESATRAAGAWTAPTEAVKPKTGLRWGRLALVALPVLAAFTRLTWPLDALVQAPLVRMTRGALVAENTAVVGVQAQGDMRGLRARHPQVIAGLVEAGATAILIDVTMTTPSEDDPALAAAIRAADAAGVAVVLPVHMGEATAAIPESPDLAAAARLGCTEFQPDLFFGMVRRAPVRRRTIDGQTWWHVAVLALNAHLRAREPMRVDGDEIVIGTTRNPVWADQAWLHPVTEIPIASYFEPGTWSVVRGRIAIVGEYGGESDLRRTPDGSRYGVELQAALIETLARQAALRVASPDAEAGATALGGILCTILGMALPRPWRPLALLVPLALVAVAVALASAGVLLGVVAPVGASLVALWAVRSRSNELR